MGHFCCKNGASSQLWIHCETFFQILHNERGQQVDENDFNNIFQKNFVWGKWTILGPKMAHPHNSRSFVRYFKILLNERGWWIHENCISCFLRRNFIWGNLISLGHFLWFDWAWLKRMSVPKWNNVDNIFPQGEFTVKGFAPTPCSILSCKMIVAYHHKFFHFFCKIFSRRRLYHLLWICLLKGLMNMTRH